MINKEITNLHIDINGQLYLVYDVINVLLNDGLKRFEI
jgi:hypothetical protein